MVDDWGFDSFELSDATQRSPLVYTGFLLFSKHKLLETFSIPETVSGAHRLFWPRFRSVCSCPCTALGRVMPLTTRFCRQVLLNFLRGIELGSRVDENPYHNDIHATDVLQVSVSCTAYLDG